MFTFCLCIISGLYSSRTYAGRVLSGNLSSGSPSFVTIYQGGIAHFNIPFPGEEIRGSPASTGGFASFYRLLITGCQRLLCILITIYIYHAWVGRIAK